MYEVHTHSMMPPITPVHVPVKNGYEQTNTSLLMRVTTRTVSLMTTLPVVFKSMDESDLTLIPFQPSWLHLCAATHSAS